jgi:ribosomal protein S18 acetylase RimI-like enzyme
MIIRPAQPSDIETLRELNDQVFQHDAQFDPVLQIQWAASPLGTAYYTGLATGTYGACFVAEDLEQAVVAGYVALHEKEFDYRNGKFLEIENIGVRPEYRSQGIGKMLMQRVREYAKEHGYTRLLVETRWGNEGARRFYQQCGFSESGVEFEGGV